MEIESTTVPMNFSEPEVLTPNGTIMIAATPTARPSPFTSKHCFSMKYARIILTLNESSLFWHHVKHGGGCNQLCKYDVEVNYDSN